MGVLIGGMLQLGINLPFLIRHKYTFSFTSKLKHPAVTSMALLIAPQLFGIAVYNLNIIVNTQFASFMPSGTVTFLYLSERLIEFPLGVIAVSIATVMLPRFSQDIADGDMKAFRSGYAYSLRISAELRPFWTDRS